MAKATIQNLITRMHEQFGDELTSPEQQELMRQLEVHVHNMDESEPVEPGFQESVELLLGELEQSHPAAATSVREILKVLGNIGI